MSSRRLAGLFAAVFFVVLIARVPLSAVAPALGLEARGVSYARAEGGIWQGRFVGLSWRGRHYGDAEISTKPLWLLLGQLKADVTLTGVANGHGQVTVWPNGSMAFTDASLTTDVAMLPVLLPMQGNISFDVRRAAFGRGGCRTVDADVHTNALVDRPAGLSWQGPVLSGTATCHQGVLVVPLIGGSGQETVAVTMQIAGDGTFVAKIATRTADEAVKGVLAAVGFTAEDGTMTFTQNGRWSGL
jgi:general secretion pathway protein N